MSNINKYSDIKKIGVVGAGTMGRGIAQVFALYNYPTVLVDREESVLQNALKKIEEKTEPDKWKKIFELLKTTKDLKQLEDCDLVIEAVFEDMSIKKELLKNLSSLCREDTIIATNTSGFLINDLAKVVNNPSRFIGMHFMNPPKAMKLVEVVKGEKTSKKTISIITEMVEHLGKIPAVVNDSPGFVSNRLLFALIGEAIRLLNNGIADKENIDKVMKYGMSHPMGPIELADFIGLDVCRDIMLYLFEQLGDSRYKPPAILAELIKEGKLGKKTGEGFYKYD